MSFAARVSPGVVLLAAFIGTVTCYWVAVGRVTLAPRKQADMAVLVRLPLFVEVVLAGGDRYLAANVGALRGMEASVERYADSRASLQTIAAIQKNVAWLNPGHEDNYYVAAAGLAGTPQHEVAQWVLRRAIDARPFDYLPPFFYAFNRMYYDHDPIDGARWLQVAAARSEDESNRAALEVMAARWTLKGEDRKLAASLLDAMAEQARTPRLRKLFEKRALQARNLARIEDGLDLYRQRRAAPAPSIEALVQAGVLSEIPVDPLGGSYVLNPDGRVRIQPAAVKVTR